MSTKLPLFLAVLMQVEINLFKSRAPKTFCLKINAIGIHSCASLPEHELQNVSWISVNLNAKYAPQVDSKTRI